MIQRMIDLKGKSKGESSLQMTYYVLAHVRAIRGFGGGKQCVPARLSDDPPWTSDKTPVLLIGEKFDEFVPPTQVLRIDGSPEARKFATKGGYKAMPEEESVEAVWRTVILKDRAAAGGRATKGVVSTRKLRAVRKNALMGGRPPKSAGE
jgi:hypothetical protein